MSTLIFLAHVFTSGHSCHSTEPLVTPRIALHAHHGVSIRFQKCIR